MKTLYLIPARGGSKGVPQKNIKPLCGKPLIYYTIDVAREIVNDEDICVSTDDPRIIKTVEDYGLTVPFIRPSEYATDTASSNDVIRHAINYFAGKGIDYDVVVLLQPTSPLRTASNIKEAIELYSDEIDMVVSVKPSHSANVICCDNKDGFLEMTLNRKGLRRQDMSKYYEYNGAIYVLNSKSVLEKGLGNLEKVRKYVMTENQSWDIDSILDWDIIEMILEKEY